jgi:ectoine hydroxylase-related dioxygenase (phytanoyl-CoA dioxygenase family)
MHNCGGGAWFGMIVTSLDRVAQQATCLNRADSFWAAWEIFAFTCSCQFQTGHQITVNSSTSDRRRLGTGRHGECESWV